MTGKTKYLLVKLYEGTDTIPKSREELTNALAGALEDAGYGFIVEDVVMVKDQALTLNIDLTDACGAIMEAEAAEK